MEERLQIGVKHLHTMLLLVLSLLVGTSRENVGWTPFYSKYFILFQLDWNSCMQKYKYLRQTSKQFLIYKWSLIKTHAKNYQTYRIEVGFKQIIF